MKVRSVKTSAQHEAFYQDVMRCFKAHSQHMPAEEMLAIASNIVGKLLAMQDQRTMSTDRAMRIVQENIEEGNAQMIREIMQSRGQA